LFYFFFSRIISRMDFIKKHFWLSLSGIGIFILYFVTRLTNILSLPIFTDEAIYIRWSEIAKQDASWRFISLTDGKQPMFVWIDMVFLKFIHDPLLASRLVSVGAGFASLLGVIALTYILFKNKWTAILAGFLYVIFPYALVYDRLAMYDSLVVTFIIWSLFVEILLVRKQRLDFAFILALVIGGGMLTKTNADFAVILLPFSLLLFDFKKKFVKKKLLKWVGLAIFASVLAYLYYSILRLSPFYHIIGDKNAVFVYPLGEWLHHPFTFFWGNFHGLSSWFIEYVTIPGIILIVAGFFLGVKSYWREKLLLLVWFAAPFVGLALFGRVLYPRYILSMVIPLLPLGAYSLVYVWQHVKRKYIAVAIMILCIALMIRSDFYIITDFYKAPIAQADVNQYANSWAAGNGVQQSVKFFKEKSQNQKIYIGTQGTFGLLPFGLEIYLANNPNVTIKGFWPINDTMPKELQEASKIMPTYVVFYQPCPSCQNTEEPPIAWPVKLLSSYEQGTSGSHYRIYQVLSQ